MTQENKELLLKDLSARLSYNVIVNEDIQGDFTLIGLTKERAFTTCEVEGHFNDFPIELVKPYLLPLSSMTEEQKGFLIKNYKFTFDSCGDNITNGVYSSAFNRMIYHTINEEDLSNIIDWLNKNHFDYRGLIEKGLAIDATGLNTY